MATSKLYVDPALIERYFISIKMIITLNRGSNDSFALTFARIESHYFVNGGFFKKKNQLLEDAKILREHKIPGIIVQGRN
jgi:hypothetical protein